MRIGIDCRLWNETGVGRYIRNLVTYLQEIDKQNEYNLFVKSGDFDQVKFQILNSKFQIFKVDIHWHSVKEQLLFSGIISKQNLDLMHFPYFSLPVMYRKPFVVTIHDLIIHDFSTGAASTLPLPLYAVKRFGFKSVFNHALSRSQKIIVPLESVKSEVAERFSLPANKIVVTSEGFDTAIQTTKTPSGRVKMEVEKGKYFLYVGNAFPHKNVGFLLSSFFEFVRKKPGHRLILVIKNDSFLEQLQSVVSNAAVSFLSDITDSDLAYVYKWSEAFVSASLMEGFGLPALEAMALGSPLLLSDIPAFREVCEDNAFYFDPKTQKSLISGFEKIVGLTDSQKTMRREKAQHRIEDFSWINTARLTKEIYESSISV